jgi:hypothetical protein
MTRQETQLAGSIDRNRAKAETSARTLQVRELARSTINCAVMEQPETDRAEFMGAAIRHLRTLYGAGEGEPEAVALFGSLAFSKDLNLGKAVAIARAEQELARLTAANENGSAE